ncbi:MAG: hypothetical protein AB4050_20010 [Synechococcus sp.]
MSATHSRQTDIVQLNETIQSLQLQLSEVSNRLAKVEGIAKSTSSNFKRNDNGNAAFLGTKYQKPEVELGMADTSRNGHFLGSNYNISDVRVKMKSDGTKRTFLGRKFGGQTLDQ